MIAPVEASATIGPARPSQASGTLRHALRVGEAESAIYTGRITHRRLDPTPHSFRYGVYYLLLNLGELDEIADRILPLGVNTAGITSFYDSDHLGPSADPVREKLARWLADQGRELPTGPVLLLTNLRVLGYVFNPVSYFYCCEPGGQIAFVVAEVNNTFGETYWYLLDDLEALGSRAARSRRRKVFHVSPFIEMDRIDYDWIFTAPGDRLSVHIDEFRAGQKFFDATLTLARRSLTTRSLLGALARYPHATVRTIARIHWQALKLWRKGAPVYRKPDPPSNGIGPNTSRSGLSHEGPAGEVRT
ncbi:MAG: DUF1365 domain-containing protein [Planctomycetota bacterium]